MKSSLGLVCALLGTFGCSSTPATSSGEQAGQGGQAQVAGTSSGGNVSASGSTATAGTGGSTSGGSPANGGTGGSATAGTSAGGMLSGGSGGTGGGSGGASGAGGSGGGGPGLILPQCPAGPFPTPQAGQAKTVCQGFQYQHGYNEGPTWVASQKAFFFSNFVQGSAGGVITGDIIKYTPSTDMCEFFVQDVGTNGLAVSPDGNIVGATHKTRSVTEFDINPPHTGTILVDMYMGQMLDSPNDLIVSSKGNIYFSNPTYELGPNRQPGVGPAIFWLDTQKKLTQLKTGGAPNGVALSPKEDRLYVVEGGIWDLDANGVPSNNRNFPLDGADGLAIDCAGNVYISSGVIREPTNGNQIATFPGGTNLAFGGDDGKTLFIVGGGTNVKVVPMNVPGLP